MMNSLVFCYGVLLFAGSLLLHIAGWRMKTPKPSSFMLIMLFLALPSALGLFLTMGYGGIRELTGLRVIEVAEALLLHLSLSAAYIASYPAVKAVSPSLDMLMLIGEAEGQRMKEHELIRHYRGSGVLAARIEDLLEDRLITEKDGQYALKPLGRLIITLFIRYRRILGLATGGG